MKHKYAVFTFPFYHYNRYENIEALFFDLFDYANEDRSDLPWLIEAASHNEAREKYAIKKATEYLYLFPGQMIYLAAQGARCLSGSDMACFFDDVKTQNDVYLVIDELYKKYGELDERDHKEIPYDYKSTLISKLHENIQFKLVVEYFKLDVISVPLGGEIR